MSDLQQQLEAKREILHSGRASEEDRAEYKSLSEQVVEERQAKRREIEAALAEANENDGIAQAQSVSSGVAVNEEG